MTEILILGALMCIGPAYLLGRYVELRRWERQRDHIGAVLDAARTRVAEMHLAEEAALSIVREQRDLLDTFAAATDRIYQCNDPDAWSRLSWARHRARTELL